MPSLAAAITTLSVAGTPIARGSTYSGKVPAVPRTYSSTFTFPKANGLPGIPRGSFAGKAATAADTKYVADTLTLVITESPIDTVTIDVDDQLRLVITEGRQVGQDRSVSDTLTVRVSDAVNSLLKSGTTAKAASDTVTLVITEGVALNVIKTVTDTLTLVCTEGSSVGKADLKSVSDTLTLRVGEVSLLNAVLANVARTVTDTLRLQVLDSSVARVSGDVDHINVILRPKGRITTKFV